MDRVISLQLIKINEKKKDSIWKNKLPSRKKKKRIRQEGLLNLLETLLERFQKYLSTRIGLNGRRTSETLS